jgi:NADH-quinone oxidoreductase subunit K
MIVMFSGRDDVARHLGEPVAWSRFTATGGQMLVIFILTVAACEAAIALAVVLTLFHKQGSLDIAVWQQLREENQPPYLERTAELQPEEPEPEWPRLPPAGIEPAEDLEEITHRSHV